MNDVDEHERVTARELREARDAYAAAEDRLIKARREHGIASQKWRNFHFPEQVNDDHEKE